MFMTKEEQEFFLSHLDKDKRVLEYGAGQSTLEIAPLVKEIVSIEHQRVYYDKLKNRVPENCTLILAEPDLPFEEGGDDGTYNQFKTYIRAPSVERLGPFDITLIDGRARVECAKCCFNTWTSDSYIFVHDIVREEYSEIFKILNHCETVGMLAKFKSWDKG